MFSGVTNTLDVYVEGNTYLEMQVPAELVQTLSNGYDHYEYADNLTIDRSSYQTTTMDLDEATGLYISDNSIQRNIGNSCVVLTGKSDVLELMKGYLVSAQVKEVTTALYKETELKSLPPYDSTVDMVLEDNMYMPVQSMTYDWMRFESRLYCEGSSRIQLVIMDTNYDDVKEELMVRCLMNTGKAQVDEWYENLDDHILYMRCENNCVVAKQIVYNNCYVYTCSADMLDYAFKGVNKVYATTE